jgi:hypothetical protein
MEAIDAGGRLAGQNHDYLVKTMNDFRDKTRGNNPGMSDLMKSISPNDIAVLGQYLAGLQIDAYLGQGAVAQYGLATSVGRNQLYDGVRWIRTARCRIGNCQCRVEFSQQVVH